MLAPDASMKGQLLHHPLGELIREISDKRLSGALRLSRERVRAALYFDEGAIVYARSNLRLHRLDDCLRRWKAVGEAQLAPLLTDGMTDVQLGAALVSSGTCTADELDDFQARQCADVLRPLLLWTDGEWHFDPRARLDEEVRVVLEVDKLLLEGARRMPPDFVASRFGNTGETLTPVPAPSAQLQLAPEEAFVLSRAESGALSVGDLITISGLPEANARRNIYVLTLGGLLARSSAPHAFSPADAQAFTQARSKAAAAPAPPREEPAKTKPAETATKTPARETTEPVWDAQAELAALFAHADAETHYATLDAARDSSPGDLKRAYYTLAKRFHPDRFHHEADAALRTRIESAFAKIARAYDVLKDPKQRAYYDAKLKEVAKAAAPLLGSSMSKKPSPDKQSKEYRAEDSFQQGMVALRQRDHVLAVSHFGEAARLMPNTGRYRAYYGHALAHEARTRRQAEVELQASITLEPRNVSYRVMLAELYSELGLRNRAEGELNRALAIDPHHTVARRLLQGLKS